MYAPHLFTTTLTAFLGLIWAIIWIVANWRLFTKADEAGWKSIIPFYNTYILYKISWKPLWFWITLGLGLCSSLMSFMTYYSHIAAAVVWLMIAMVAVIGVMQTFKLSYSFGHGVLFALGLVFLNPLFILILAFGDAQYVGPQD